VPLTKQYKNPFKGELEQPELILNALRKIIPAQTAPVKTLRASPPTYLYGYFHSLGFVKKLYWDADVAHDVVMEINNYEAVRRFEVLVCTFT
jgi:hypothetical protein